MLNDAFQNLLSQISSVIPAEFGIANTDGLILACTTPARINSKIQYMYDIVNCNQDTISFLDVTYMKLYNDKQFDFILFVESTDPNTVKYLDILSISIKTIKAVHLDKYGKPNFIRSIIMSNILPGDILIKATELQITPNVDRIVLSIKLENIDFWSVEKTLLKLASNPEKDFIIRFDLKNMAIVRELRHNEDSKSIYDLIDKIIKKSKNQSIFIGIGSIVNSIKEINQSFKEAQIALLVGCMFDSSTRIFNFNNLGIGRLIYQLPITLCRLFLKEVFKEGTLESLDEEILLTIQVFFQHSLNISETARVLFIHRNTLVYRLDKIQRYTGLDLRMFDDAITFKVAMLVKKYLEANRM